MDPPVPAPWFPGFVRGRPCLIHAGLGRGWWGWSGGFAVADDHRLWVLARGRATPIRAVEVEDVGEDERGLVVVGRALRIRFDPRTGHIETEDAFGRRVRPVPGGDAEVWLDDEAGFVYRRCALRTRAIEALLPGEQVRVGPHGALLVGRSGWTRGGAPGRSPRPLPVPLAPEPVRWSADGRRVAGIGDDRGAVIDLLTGHLARVDGVPVSIDAQLRPDGRIWRDGHPVHRGLVEASAAVWGPWLAGPGGWVWSLAGGRPVRRRRVVALGATVGTPAGFVTVDWETGRGWTVGFDGQRRQPFRLPLAPDDTVAAGRAEGGAVWLETALGERFRVADGAVAREGGGPAIDPPMPARMDTPVGPFQATVQAEVDGTRFAANDDGWLIGLPPR